MASNSSSLMLGIAVGAAIGVFAQRFCSSSRGKRLKHKACCKLNKLRDKVEDTWHSAKEKATDIESEIEEKVENIADEVSDKVEPVIKKVSSFTDKNMSH
ncbi:MAG: YtxH domain-containing protein [Bacteroides sp.]|nr:YtxH domain-containing protein [Roseburia sp.]MCM1345904.1 YtxH domain-containing protein [Bacteroides sp.]MCM1421379.1 YtxH domain-containing protein [Bacteroides sp.]